MKNSRIHFQILQLMNQHSCYTSYITKNEKLSDLVLQLLPLHKIWGKSIKQLTLCEELRLSVWLGTSSSVRGGCFRIPGIRSIFESLSWSEILLSKESATRERKYIYINLLLLWSRSLIMLTSLTTLSNWKQSTVYIASLGRHPMKEQVTLL